MSDEATKKNQGGSVLVVLLLAAGFLYIWWSYSKPKTFVYRANSANGVAQVNYETASGTISQTVRTPWTFTASLPRDVVTFSVSGERASCEIVKDGRRVAFLEGDAVHCSTLP